MVTEAEMHALIRRILWAACDEEARLEADSWAASRIMSILKDFYTKENNASQL